MPNMVVCDRSLNKHERGGYQGKKMLTHQMYLIKRKHFFFLLSVLGLGWSDIVRPQHCIKPLEAGVRKPCTSDYKSNH